MRALRLFLHFFVFFVVLSSTSTCCCWGYHNTMRKTPCADFSPSVSAELTPIVPPCKKEKRKNSKGKCKPQEATHKLLTEPVSSDLWRDFFFCCFLIFVAKKLSCQGGKVQVATPGEAAAPTSTGGCNTSLVNVS
ncbi:hypothetical protein HDK90DRAFT_483026 [Phyllosticta capitalensis]|uniref:Secreted protein n=1 Tax=Phyllosticta capitalensis TaxID=121624 RepID=A0ABR1YTQ1_9PEZI